ncbi:MAG TPA: hypothetical protein VGJ21_11850 [Terracidiphilus sp.]
MLAKILTRDKQEICAAIQQANIDRRSDKWLVAQRVLGLLGDVSTEHGQS